MPFIKLTPAAYLMLRVAKTFGHGHHFDHTEHGDGMISSRDEGFLEYLGSRSEHRDGCALWASEMQECLKITGRRANDAQPPYAIAGLEGWAMEGEHLMHQTASGRLRFVVKGDGLFEVWVRAGSGMYCSALEYQDGNWRAVPLDAYDADLMRPDRYEGLVRVLYEDGRQVLPGQDLRSVTQYDVHQMVQRCLDGKAFADWDQWHSYRAKAHDTTNRTSRITSRAETYGEDE